MKSSIKTGLTLWPNALLLSFMRLMCQWHCLHRNEQKNGIKLYFCQNHCNVWILLLDTSILSYSKINQLLKIVLSQTILYLTKIIKKDHQCLWHQISITRYDIKYIFIIYLFGIISFVILHYKVSQIDFGWFMTWFILEWRGYLFKIDGGGILLYCSVTNLYSLRSAFWFSKYFYYISRHIVYI